jgi:hypothetical protein
MKRFTSFGSLAYEIFTLYLATLQSNQLSEMAFRNNVAHSNAEQGLTTYRPGWKPEQGAVFDGFKAYKNGCKSLRHDISYHLAHSYYHTALTFFVLC